MANNAHLIHATDGRSTVVVRDDRGMPVTELAVAGGAAVTEQADEELLSAGWTRSADWSTADDGWLAPVVPS